mgnify:CR=1 FL=1
MSRTTLVLWLLIFIQVHFSNIIHQMKIYIFHPFPANIKLYTTIVIHLNNLCCISWNFNPLLVLFHIKFFCTEIRIMLKSHSQFRYFVDLLSACRFVFKMQGLLDPEIDIGVPMSQLLWVELCNCCEIYQRTTLMRAKCYWNLPSCMFSLGTPKPYGIVRYRMPL